MVPSGPTTSAPPTSAAPASGRLILTFTATDRPDATARFDGETRDAFVASHCWGKPSVEPAASVVYCVDTVAPSAELLSPLLELPQGTELAVEGDATSVGCLLAPISSPSLPEPGPGHPLAGLPDREPGTYSLGCLATWPHGDVPFFFGVEIVP